MTGIADSKFGLKISGMPLVCLAVHPGGHRWSGVVLATLSSLANDTGMP